MSGSGGAAASTLDALLHGKISVRDGFEVMKSEFLNYEALNSSPMSTNTDDLAQGGSDTYFPATDEFSPRLMGSNISREGMADPQGAVESINVKNSSIEQPKLPIQYTTSKAQLARFADDVISQLSGLTRVEDADVRSAVQSLMENVLVHPPVASNMKLYGAMFDSMDRRLDEPLRLAPNQVRMVESMFNYKIPGLLRGVGRNPSTGLVTYDKYGRPEFEASIVIPNTPPQTVANAQHMNVIVRGVPIGLRSMERAEDVIRANYMQNARHVDRMLRISLPTAGNFTHSQFISEFQRVLAATLTEDDTDDYTVSVRFDIGSKAGVSGVDAFAPHIVFGISKSMGRSKRPAEAPRGGGGGGDGAPKTPKKPKPNPNPTPSRKRSASSMLIGALNGNDSIVNRPWTTTLDEVEDDESSESSSGVGPEGRRTPHVLFGDKVRPGQPRPAELLVEHHRKSTLEAGRVQPLYMSSPPSQSDLDFGDVSEPVAMQSQMEDHSDVGFHAQLMIDLKMATGFTAADPPPAAFGFTSIKDYKPSGGGARAGSTGSADWWHALAYVTFVKSSDFEDGKVTASEAIAAMYTSLTAQERVFLAVKDAFVVNGGRYSAATLLTPSEALAQAGSYAPGTFALPGTRFKGILSDEVAQFAVRRPVWRMPHSWTKETVTILRAGGRDRLRDDTQTWERQSGAILASLAAQIKGYSSKLEDEYVKATRTLRSASYLRMCREYIQDGVAIIGTGPMLGEVLAVVLMREAAFVAAYPARAEACASALCEAIQLFALVSGESVPGAPDETAAEEWYVDMMQKVCSVTDDGTFDASIIDTESLGRMKMQIDKGPNEEADAWSWLVGEESITDAIKKHLRSSNLDLISKPDDLKSYDDLDSEIKRVLSIKEVVKGTTEKMRMAEYVGTDFLASLLDGFDPVLFISLCHPDRVLLELPQPSIQTDEYEDDAYTPAYSGISATAYANRGAASDADTGTLPQSLNDVLNTVVKTYVAAWTSALSNTSPAILKEPLILLQGKALGKLKPVETMKAFVEGIFGNTQGRRIWIHNFYDIVYAGDPSLPDSFDAANTDEAMMAKLATIAVMRPLLKATLLDPTAKKYDDKVTESLKKISEGALSIVKTLNALEAANNGVTDHVLRFFASLEPTRTEKFAQKAYSQKTIDALVNPGLGIGNVTEAKQLFARLVTKTVSMKQLGTLSDLFGSMERIASSAPGTLAALFFDNGELGLRQQPGAALLLRYYAMRWSAAENNHPRTSVAPYFSENIALDDGGVADSSSAVAPQPVGGARLPIFRTRAPLLSVHNVMSEFAKCAAQNDAGVLPFESYSNSLPKHGVSAEDDGGREARLPASTSSTLLHRAATRRKQLDASRVNLNGNRAFNWISPDAEHLRLMLDDSDPWGGAMRPEGKSKRILTMDYTGRKINESLIPDAVNLPYEPSAVDANPLNVSDAEYDTVVSRDLKRWSWILDFGAHDASYFRNESTFEQIVGGMGAMEPSRRVVSESDGSHVSLSVLAKTSKYNDHESVSVNGVSERGQATSEFSAGQLLSVKGANTLSDRLFLSNGFLDLKSLVQEYTSEYEENGMQTWLTPHQHAHVYESDMPSNEQALPLRMSERAMERFTKLRNAHGVLASIHMRSKLDAVTDVSSAQLMRTLYRPSGADSSDLAAFEHLRFGSATKDSFSSESTAGAQHTTPTFAQSIPVNQRFIHFSDVVESLKPGQPFRPYTFDDFAAHSVDVCERIHALTKKVRTPDGAYKVQGFASSQATIDMCSDLSAYVDSLLSACAIAKVVLMTLHSPNFARMHAYEPPNPARRKHQQWGVWTFPGSRTYDLDTDDSIVGGSATTVKLRAILEEIDGTMASYYSVGEQLVKLKVEASFLMRVGKELYKRASTNTCQRIVTDQLQTNYVPYSSSQFSTQNFRPSESSDELQLAVKRTFSKPILSSSSRRISGGWGSMYTLGGQSTLQDALAGRGHLHPDARYYSKLKANPENIHWCSTSALHGCNYDFGIYGLYAAYLSKVDASQEEYELDRDAKELDLEGGDGLATLTETSVRPTRGTGTAFQYWGITTLLQDKAVRSSWKSVERLPTFAELVSEFGHLDASSPYRSHCFDGIETRFLPDMQRKGELIRVATNRFASWLASARFRASSREPLFLSDVFDVRESYVSLDTQLIETAIKPYERNIVKEFALVMESIPPRLWNSWKLLSSETLFMKNRRIESASQEWQALSSMLEADDADTGERAAEEIAITGDGDEGEDVQRPDTVEAPAGPEPDDREPYGGGAAMQTDDPVDVIDVIDRSRAVAQDRASREETQRQLQSERQEVDTCPERLAGGGYTVIETPKDGNCLYTSVAELMNRRRILDPSGDLFDVYSMRVRVANFFMADPASLSLDMQGLYFPLYQGIRADISSFGTAETAENVLFEFARENLDLVSLAREPDDTREAQLQTMRRYGEAVATTDPPTWANSPEMEVLAHLLSVKLCIYTPVSPGTLQRGTPINPQATVELPLLWTNPVGTVTGTRAHYEALVVYVPLPEVVAPMEMGSFLKRASPYQGATFECVFEAVATAMKQYGHPQAKTAAEMRSDFASWVRAGLRSKSMPAKEREALKAVANGGVIPSRDSEFTLNEGQLQGLPYAIRSNLAVYNSLDAEGTRSVLVEAHAPFSCAHRLKLIRLPPQEGAGCGAHVYGIA